MDGDTARAEARARDDEHASGREPGVLHGVPVGIKDIIDVAGMPTTAGGPPFAHTRPDRDATLVARLRAAGAVIVGKTVATPFAYRDPAGTRNPWALDHTPGGSSSGSAAAVAARHVPVAIGTQTIGSILRPAAFCGVVGLKGDYGDVPLNGVLPLGASLDHAGPLARSVADAALVVGVLTGRPITAGPGRPPRLVVPPELLDLAEPALRTHLMGVVAALAAAGATIVDEPLPVPVRPVVAAGQLVLEAEAAAQHRAWYGQHAAEYPPRIAELIEAGQRHDERAIAAAQRERAAFRDAVGPLLATFDALLSPVAPGPAPALGSGTGDPTLCAPWTYAGLPALSLPTGLDGEGLPLAAQLVGGEGRIRHLLDAAVWCERVVAFDARPPHVGQ